MTVHPVQMGGEMIQRVGHVPVAQVPRPGAIAEHRPVVLLSGGDDLGVAFGVEELILGRDAVVRQDDGRLTAQVDELLKHAPPARLAYTKQHRPAVPRLVGRMRLQARIPLSRARRRVGIDPVQVRDHRLHRGAQAVEIQAVEARLCTPATLRVVVRAQPPDEVDDVGVAPHPRREASEPAQRLLGIAVALPAP